MNLDYLDTFRELVRLGSFSAVAKNLSISQPAVSFQIQKLESDLGATLIDRSQKKLRLTDAGNRLLEYAKLVNHEHVKLQNDLDKLRTDVVGEINIASSTIPGEFLVPPLLGAFTSFHKNTTAHVDVMDSITVIDSVKHGDYKLGFCGSTPPEKDGLTSFRIASDEIILIVSPSHPLATKKEVHFEELFDYALICREVTSGTRQSLEKSMANSGFDFHKLKPRLVLPNTGAVTSAVEAGNGIAFISSIGAKKSLELGTIKRLEIKGFHALRNFYCVYYPSRENLRLLDEFISFIHQTTKNPEWLRL